MMEERVYMSKVRCQKANACHIKCDEGAYFTVAACKANLTLSLSMGLIKPGTMNPEHKTLFFIPALLQDQRLPAGLWQNELLSPIDQSVLFTLRHLFPAT